MLSVVHRSNFLSSMSRKNRRLTVVARGIRHPQRAVCGAAIKCPPHTQMPDDAGHEISGLKIAEIEKAATKAASEGTEDARDQWLG